MKLWLSYIFTYFHQSLQTFKASFFSPPVSLTSWWRGVSRAAWWMPWCRPGGSAGLGTWCHTWGWRWGKTSRGADSTDGNSSGRWCQSWCCTCGGSVGRTRATSSSPTLKDAVKHNLYSMMLLGFKLFGLELCFYTLIYCFIIIYLGLFINFYLLIALILLIYLN